MVDSHHRERALQSVHQVPPQVLSKDLQGVGGMSPLGSIAVYLEQDPQGSSVGAVA